MNAGINIELDELDELDKRIPRVRHEQKKKQQIIEGKLKNFVKNAKTIVLWFFLLCLPQKVKLNNCGREHNEYDEKTSKSHQKLIERKLQEWFSYVT